ncbi:PCI domain-containing protein [Plasmodiophora brassicae]|uniref:PCI domain-containing protein n=1 Tax=Plasmodiophora brassicae TaxID=37360 RepID=A0A0G4II69_PLABS|nr:hypothetical protein PBRA_003744 [Plasmodiophora brassicae]SPQ94263.1 unnamed protein product [Plasmodiophora brassicae]
MTVPLAGSTRPHCVPQLCLFIHGHNLVEVNSFVDVMGLITRSNSHVSLSLSCEVRRVRTNLSATMAQQLVAFVKNVKDAIDSEDGKLLSAYLDLSPSVVAHPPALLKAFEDENALRSACSRLLTGNFVKIVEGHYRCLYLASVNRFIEGFEQQSECASAFLAEMNMERPEKTNWWLRPIHTMMITFRNVAFKADEQKAKEQGNSKSVFAIQVPEVLQRFFRRMIQDRSQFNVSKIAGALFTVNEMLKVYFHINNLRLCTQTIRTVEGQTFPALENFPKSQTVTYNYFLGRLKLFDEQYEQAEKSLQWAFSHCHRGAWKNKRKILEFLIPVKLYLGKYPKRRLLEKYKLMHFHGIVAAMSLGRLDLFENELKKHEEAYIKKGVFLTLEQLKMFVYRNLFSRVLAVQQARPTNTKKSLLPFDVMQLAMRLNNRPDIDCNEIECITANLIYDKFLKGYIAHQRGVMVSQTDPFPAINRSSA